MTPKQFVDFWMKACALHEESWGVEPEMRYHRYGKSWSQCIAEAGVSHEWLPVFEHLCDGDGDPFSIRLDSANQTAEEANRQCQTGADC